MENSISILIAVLIAILLPTLSRAREAGNRTACLSNLRQLDQLFVMYGQLWKDRVPIGYIESPFPGAISTPGKQCDFVLRIDATVAGVCGVCCA